MLYKSLVELYQKLEATTKKLEKTRYIAEFLKQIKEKELNHILCLIQGTVFPKWDQREIGFSSKLMLRAIARAAGVNASVVEKKWKDIGDLGIVAEGLIEEKKQRTLAAKELTTQKVFENIRKLAGLEGPGTIDRKISLVAELLTSATPLEARYIVRTILEEMRIGVAEGIVRDAIALAYSIDPKVIERAYDLLLDFGEVAQLAKKGTSTLEELSLAPGRPLQVMLAIRVESIEEAFKALGKPAQFEVKLDGFRAQIHYDGKDAKLFTRRMENVTKQFPELLPILKKNVKAKSYIIDTELVGYDPKTKKYMPFQNISQRIKRKYGIIQMAKELPVEINVFDLIYYNGKSLIKKPLKERRALLEKIIKEVPRKIVLTRKLITDDVKKAEKFYKEVLKEGFEGVMIKNINSAYVPGRRVGGWLKLKPIMETLDLVIIGAQWGEGKRSNWLSSFTLACKHGNKFLAIGKVGTGIKEKEGKLTFKELTEQLKPYIIETKGKNVKIKPALVFEIAYEEIQKSPTYESGFALRFPRVLRVRYDKSIKDVDTLERVKRLYEKQK